MRSSRAAFASVVLASFVIAGLLDQHVTENLNRIPGLSNIPLLGALFKSRSLNKNDSDLLVLVTPEFQAPLATGDARPKIPFERDFMKGPGDQK